MIYDNINYSSDISYLTNTFIYEYDIAKANYDSVSVPDEKYQNIVQERQIFSLEGEFIYGDDSTNMAVSDYFEGIMNSYNMYITQ